MCTFCSVECIQTVQLSAWLLLSIMSNLSGNIIIFYLHATFSQKLCNTKQAYITVSTNESTKSTHLFKIWRLAFSLPKAHLIGFLLLLSKLLRLFDLGFGYSIIQLGSRGYVGPPSNNTSTLSQPCKISLYNIGSSPLLSILLILEQENTRPSWPPYIDK